MLNFVKLITLLAMTASLCACQPDNPEDIDLHSPCVSAGGMLNFDDPCVERRPKLNPVFEKGAA